MVWIIEWQQRRSKRWFTRGNAFFLTRAEARERLALLRQEEVLQTHYPAKLRVRAYVPRGGK